MTENDVTSLLTFCKNIWPDYFVDMSRSEGFKLIDEWKKAFETVPRKKVLTAIYTLQDLATPPNVDEILEKIDNSMGGINWPRLKESYMKHGYYWPEKYEQKLQEVEKCIL